MFKIQIIILKWANGLVNVKNLFYLAILDKLS